MTKSRTKVVERVLDSLQRQLIYACRFAILTTPIVLGSCCRTPDILGKWQCGGLFISVHDDGVASFSGERATWTSIGRDEIRLEFQENGAPKIVEFKMLKATESEPRAALLNIGGQDIDCDEVRPEDERTRG